jgi:hypothetical protein
MNKIFLIIAFFFAFFSSCEFKKSKHISIHYTGEIGFKRSYASIQFVENEKEINEYLEKQHTNNPIFSDTDNNSLKKQFERLGLTIDDDLLLSKFVSTNKEENQIIDNKGNKIKVVFQQSPDTGERWLNILSGKDSSKIKIDAHFMDLQYSIIDVIPGRNKEIVVLSQYYIMNGDNFDFLVYEIRNE